MHNVRRAAVPAALLAVLSCNPNTMLGPRDAEGTFVLRGLITGSGLVETPYATIVTQGCSKPAGSQVVYGKLTLEFLGGTVEMTHDGQITESDGRTRSFGGLRSVLRLKATCEFSDGTIAELDDEETQIGEWKGELRHSMGFKFTIPRTGLESAPRHITQGTLDAGGRLLLHRSSYLVVSGEVAWQMTNNALHYRR